MLLERRFVVANGCKDLEIVKRANGVVEVVAILGPCVVRVARDDQRQAQLGGQPRRLGDQEVIVGQQMVLELQEEAALSQAR